ncbi:hypothetical protein A2U01_0021548 [Trifolium medium]|uniref:Uncharacterized protein n=1 Tax=Trifolium medium TaxID=97028 RepID=A0A392NKW6_9FABA|nr:hypothetical protein [Trifolium medium]
MTLKATILQTSSPPFLNRLICLKPALRSGLHVAWVVIDRAG